MFSLILSEPEPDSASMDSYFLQLLICLCIIIFQEYLLITFSQISQVQ